MPISKVPDESKAISLRRWRVMEIEVQDGTRSRHILGHDVKQGLGRASSPITDFNLDTMTATTRSGSSYKLVGLPGNSRLGKNAWSNWCRDNIIISELDVTKEYFNINQVSTIGFKRITNTANRKDEQ